jgi:hypothetical protein
MRRLLASISVIALMVGLAATRVSAYRADTPQKTRAAKPDVKVWVNTASGVYHCPGTRWYGNTKRGEYMAQTEAQQNGFRPAYGKPCQQAAGTDATRPADAAAAAASKGGGDPDIRVWVNTSSAVYHCPGTRWYGNTKAGEYMTQKEAQGKGDRPAYGKPCQ